ncbi:AMP-binding protein [Streptomyces sp. CA-100214]
MVDPGDPELVCGLIQTVIEALVAALDVAPETPLYEVDPLSPVERERVVTDWNDTGVVVGDVSVLGLFGEVVGRDRGAVAVVCGDERVSYGELDVRSDRLAGVLAGLGVGVESVVGVVLERSVDLVVALLAVWKVGVCMCRWMWRCRRSGWVGWWGMRGRCVWCRVVGWWGFVGWCVGAGGVCG